MIDIYTHITPSRFYAALEKMKATGPIPKVPALSQLDVRLKLMEEIPDVQQVLTVSGPPLETLVKTEDSISLSRIANDEIAEICQKYPDKFVAGIAAVPLADIPAALEEIDRAIKNLGLKGIQIYTNVLGKPLDAPEFMPVYEKMVRYDLPVFIHPINFPGEVDYPGESRSKFNLNGILGWPHATSKAMVRIAGSGILEKLPDLKFVTHHCGGTVPYLAGRIGHSPFMGKGLNRPVTESLVKFYNDTAVQGNVSNLMCGYTFCGGDHIVFGTDFPYANPDTVKIVIQSINAMFIPAADKQKIFSENARKLLKI